MLKKFTIFYFLFLFFIFGCSDREIVIESQITDDILRDENYIGRLPEEPDRHKVGMFYYNTKKLHFYICEREIIWTGKTAVPINDWNYITLDNLREKLRKSK